MENNVNLIKARIQTLQPHNLKLKKDESNT